MYNNVWQMKCTSFIKIITLFQRVLCTGTQTFLNPSGKKDIGRDRSNVCTASLILSALQTFTNVRLLLVVHTCDYTMELGPNCMGVWENFKFQGPDRFNGSCRGTGTRVIVEETSALDVKR
jgi:hypothetical protein